MDPYSMPAAGAQGKHCVNGCGSFGPPPRVRKTSLADIGVKAVESTPMRSNSQVDMN
jgi:hypothetical protein